MLEGVTLIDPEKTYMEVGSRSAGIRCSALKCTCAVIPPSARAGDRAFGGDQDTRIGDRCRILFAMLESARLENDVDMGPFGHLRKGAHLDEHVHMGNFGEIKNSHLGPGTKMGHFSYIGDAEIGPNVNIGAGTVTCNFDGEGKFKTEIGEGAFIGSDTMLVAPHQDRQGRQDWSGLGGDA